MRKNILISLCLLLIFSMAWVSPGIAKGSKTNFKGRVTVVLGEGLFQIETNKGETEILQISNPDNLPVLEVGMYIHVKGTELLNGTVAAEWIRIITEKEYIDEGENTIQPRSDNPSCDPEKGKGLHPVAAAIAKAYKKNETEINEMFCRGYGLGQIMLSLQTEKIDSQGRSYQILLELRNDGWGWGQIWKEMGLIGNRGNNDPPGFNKKPNKRTR